MINSDTIKTRILKGIPLESFDDGATIQSFIDMAVHSVEKHIGMPLAPTTYRQAVDTKEYMPGVGHYIIPARVPVINSDNTFGKDWIQVNDEDYVEYQAGFAHVPEDINQVIFNLAMYEINRAMGNTYNQSTKTVVSGQTTANISKSPEDFYGDELRRLDQYVMKHPYANVMEIETFTLDVPAQGS